MRKKKLSLPKKECFLCYYFTFYEFTIEQIKLCVENWLDADKCPNWRPVDAYIGNKKVIWIEN